MWSKLNVDMFTGTVKKEPMEEQFRELGGRALVVQYIVSCIPPACNPFSAENMLLICGGVYAGTNFTTAHRLSIGGKSPLTGGIKECNVGGNLGTHLAEQGLKMIAVGGKPKDNKLFLLHIKADGSAELLDAEQYRGMGNYSFVEAMQKRFGDKVAVASIGIAGERLYKAASIQVTEVGAGYPSRAAARGGIGALMGSKGLKAIVIEKPTKKFKVPYANEELFRKAASELNKIVAAAAPTTHSHNYGTVAVIEHTGASGCLPVKNFSGDLFPDYKKVGVEVFMRNLLSRGGSNKKICQTGCLVQCSNVYNDADGKYLTSALEYETIALFGPNCLISDLDAIARMDYMCDDMGLDTIDTACAVAVAMECGKINWGDAEAAIGLLEEIKQGTEFGNIMGNGCEATGLHLGCKRIPAVKHQSLGAYDPRNTKGTGITYATSPQGADHTAGITMGRAFDDTGRTAQAYASNRIQVAMCIADSMMCLFVFAIISQNFPQLLSMFVGLYGGEPDISRITVGLGAKTLLTERYFNKQAGITAEQDKLPGFFHTEMSAATGSVFDINPVELETVFDF